jgi:hypothetical protein
MLECFAQIEIIPTNKTVMLNTCEGGRGRSLATTVRKATESLRFKITECYLNLTKNLTETVENYLRTSGKTRNITFVIFLTNSSKIPERTLSKPAAGRKEGTRRFAIKFFKKREKIRFSSKKSGLVKAKTAVFVLAGIGLERTRDLAHGMGLKKFVAVGKIPRH